MGAWIHFSCKDTNFDTQIFILRVFNPIPPGLWNDVVTWVFLTRSTFQPYNLVKSHATIKNLFPDKIFDIQTSFGTTISTVKEVWPSISVRQSQSLPVY